MSAETKYRNVTVDETGRIRGEKNLALIGAHDTWCGFEASLDLHVISEAMDRGGEAAARIWSLQDGYGEAGLTPVQGYDWSGVRDSTPEARFDMFVVALQYVGLAEVAEQFGLPLDGLTPAIMRACS